MFSTDYNNHELVSFFNDPKTGLKAIIAIHSTKLGPALGGCRLKLYDFEKDAIADVLRLAQGMTYKSAISDLPFGGGKMVILGNSCASLPREVIFEKVAGFINNLGGTYITSLDSGTSFEDLNIIAKNSSNVVGHMLAPIETSQFTAYSVMNSMKVAIDELYSHQNFKDIKVAIQGIGKTGFYLGKYLHELGVTIYVADYNTALVDEARSQFDAIPVSIDDISSLDVDIFAPCGFGSVITKNNVDKLNCKIICGAANNQLETPDLGQVLFNKNILYVPDYVANSGGIISLYYNSEIVNNQSDNAFLHIDKMNSVLSKIFELSKNLNIATNQVADSLALEKLNK